jgi:DNA-directed RNA polymerase specialized sigma24 family protein
MQIDRRQERSASVEVDPVAQLEVDWERDARRRVRARLRRWRAVEPTLARFSNGDELLAMLHGPAGASEKDGVMLALVRLARSEQLAGRVVLQALLPGLKMLWRRLFRGDASRAEIWQLLLAAAWERIVTYPVERRPGRIAANLLLDTLRATLHELAHERPSFVLLSDGALPAPACPKRGNVDALLARAVSLGVVSASDAELVLETRIDGRDLAEAGARQGASYNTIKLRRQRAERRLLLLLGFPSVPRSRQPRPSFLDEPALQAHGEVTAPALQI